MCKSHFLLQCLCAGFCTGVESGYLKSWANVHIGKRADIQSYPSQGQQWKTVLHARYKRECWCAYHSTWAKLSFMNTGLILWKRMLRLFDPFGYITHRAVFRSRLLIPHFHHWAQPNWKWDVMSDIGKKQFLEKNYSQRYRTLLVSFAF